MRGSRTKKRWQAIRNREELVGHGPHELRQAAIDIIECAIRAADPYSTTLDLLTMDDDHLQVGEIGYDLREWDHVYVIGAGKATQPIAMALEELLGGRLSDGLVILKRGEGHHLRRIRVIEAAHPVPDEDSHRGAQEVVKLARRAGPKDLVFAAITGGSSALLVWPPEGVSLADLQVLNELLLRCGASIREINAVRKHVSRVKGGRLAQEVFPAQLVNLTVSDVTGDPLDYITGPTVPDTSTYEDAWRTLDRYDLWEQVPTSVRDHLRRGREIETPKAFSHVHHSFVVVPGDAACRGASQRCEELGYSPHIVTTEMEGESWEEALGFVEAAGAMDDRSALIAGGETIVTIQGECGRGGPNQEFALSAALGIAGRKDLVVASIDTDGTDGPTEASGGLVDGWTVERARVAGLDPERCRIWHSALELLRATGDLVVTGATGTNVNDLKLLLKDS
ncbi:MAG: glycerate kinase [Anaerolineae bacterium]|jgi:hydroxypyruvate reductase/glycerate 2-kinase